MCYRTLALFLVLAAPALAASFPPELRFRTVVAGRIRVHHHQGLERTAQRVAAMAPEILERHEARYGTRLRGLDIVLADVEDEPNGFATPLPYPLVHLRAIAPTGDDESGNYEDWMRLILTHELAHSVHLDAVRGLPGVGRKVFGRAPILFPNGSTPTWMVEGLATFEETETTAFGRGRNPDSQMVVRMAALEGGIPGADRATRGLDRWPGGQAPYLFGEAFLRDLTVRFGERTLPELSRTHSGRAVPYLDELTSRLVTGASFATRWSEWAAREEEQARRFDALRRERGLTEARPLTTRGIRQTGPRFSPDGAWIAYTSRTLDRFRAIHLVRPDGTGDRRLTLRNSGSGLSFAPDGKALVFDAIDLHGIFRSVSDLHEVDIAKGRTRRLTRGLRARDPDVSPDGAQIAFVRQLADRSEIALLPRGGGPHRDLTRSDEGVQWARPVWSPGGDLLAASRWRAGGFLDIVLVDPATGAVTTLIEDRAKDVEPTWTPDGSHVVFRSDRDGVSNLYALNLADRVLRRVTNVRGGAFEPAMSPDGRTVAYADYSARGYDIHLASVDVGMLAAAEPFVDPYPPAQPVTVSEPLADRAYRPFPALLPRFWMPWVGQVSDEVRAGVVTGGTDPLFRHAYGLDVHYGFDTRAVGFQGYYQYDRFRPTLSAFVENETDTVRDGLLRARKLELRANAPLRRRLRASHSLSLAYRRGRDTLEGPEPERLDLGGIEAAWSLSTVRQYPYSISPVDGSRVRVAFLREEKGLGSDVSLGKVTGDLRTYARVFGENDVLALRAGGGATFGRPSFLRSFAVGGFPDGALFDVVRTNHSVLRGYKSSAFTGRRFAHANAEYRFPLAHPQRGLFSLPVFVRHLHGHVFADAAHAWSQRFALRDVKTGVGAGLGVDLVLGHGLPLTSVVGVARGLAEHGDTRVFVRTGLSF